MSCMWKSDDVAGMPRFKHSQKLFDVISKLIFSLVIMVMMMETLISAQLAPCPTAQFPLIFGGSGSETKILAMDMLELSSGIIQLAVAGFTTDGNLRGNSTYAKVPALLFYQGTILTPIWGLYVEIDDYEFRGVAISKDGDYVVAHSVYPADGERPRVLIAKTDNGNTRRVFQQVNGIMNYYRMQRTILVSSLSTNKPGYYTMTFSGRRFVSTDYLGLSIVGVDFNTDIFSPTLNMPDIRYIIRTDSALSTDRPRYLDYADTQQYVLLTATVGAQLLITMFKTDNGDDLWTLALNPLGDDFCISDFRDVGTDYTHFTIVGKVGTDKQIARIQIDPTSRQPIGNKGDLFSDPRAKDWVPIAIKTESYNIFNALFQDPSTLQVYFGYYQIDKLFTSKRKIFAAFTAQQEINSLGLFKNDLSFFVAFNGQNLYKDPYNSADKMTLSQVSGFILSSQESQGCYTLNSDALFYDNLALSSVSLLPYVGSSPYASSTLYEIIDSVKQVIPLALGAMSDKSGSCWQNPYIIDQTVVHSPTTLEYYAGIAKSFSVLPFQATQQCVSALPDFAYTADHLISGSMPSYLSFNPTTGLFTVDDTGTLGNEYIRYKGVLANGQFDDEVFLFVGLACPPPTFDAPPASLTLALDFLPHVFALPHITTLAGTGTALVSVESTLQDGTTQTPAFLTQIPMAGPDPIISLQPLTFADMGTFLVAIALGNECPLATTRYPISVTVTNTQPIFDMGSTGDLPGTNVLTLEINQLKEYSSKTFSDAEGHIVGASVGDVQLAATAPLLSLIQVTVVYDSTSSRWKVSVFSQNYANVGKVSVISLKLKDGEPNAGNDYSFFVTFTNTPPVFSSLVPTIFTVKLNQVKNYTLPAYHDPESMPVFVSTSGRNQILQSSISVSADHTYLTFHPVDFTLLGTHTLSILLSDGQPLSTSYPLTLIVTNTPPYFNQSQPPAALAFRFGFLGHYDLPPWADDEGHTVYLVTTKSEALITQVDRGYIFEPKVASQDIGEFLIQGYITDRVSSKSRTEFAITVTIFNDPPKFTQKLSTVRVTQGDTISYNFPSYEEKEGLPVQISLKYLDQKKLPPFMKAYNNGQAIDFAPTNLTKPGLQIVQVELSDGYAPPSSYSLKVIVLAKPKPSAKVIESVNLGGFQVQKVLAQMKVLQVTKDGVLMLKISSKSGQAAITQDLVNETFSVQMLTGEKKKVNFTIVSKEVNQGIVNIQLKFEDPSKVSVGKTMDYVVITTAKQTIVQTPQALTILSPGLRQTSFVPSQVSKATAQLAASLTKSMSVMKTAFLPGMVLINLALSVFIQYLWGLLNDMSFLTILTLISINVPGIAKTIQGTLLSFIYLDILMTDLWFLKVFYSDQEGDGSSSTNRLLEEGVVAEQEDQDALNGFFDENGFQSKSLVKNLGSTFIYICLYLIGYLLIGIFRCWQPDSPRLLRFQAWLEKCLLWNSALRFILQQFPPILISSLINLHYLRFDKLSNIICSVLAMGLSFGLQAGIGLMALKIYRSRNQLASEEFQEKFGTLTEGVQMKSIVGVYWNIITLVRWSFTILILVVLRDSPEWQIMLLLIVSVLFQALYFRFRPLLESLENSISLFNEFMVSFYLYVLLSLTDFNTENRQRELCGLLLVLTILLSTCVGFCKFFFLIGRALCDHFRKKRLARLAEERAERARRQADFKRQSKTLELQDNNPYAYSLERPPRQMTLMVEARTRNASVVSTLNLLGSVPYRAAIGGGGGEGVEERQGEMEEFKRLFGETQGTQKGLLMIEAREETGETDQVVDRVIDREGSIRQQSLFRKSRGAQHQRSAQQSNNQEWQSFQERDEQESVVDDQFQEHSQYQSDYQSQMRQKDSHAKSGYSSRDSPDHFMNEINSYFQDLSQLQSNLNLALTPAATPFDQDNPVDAFKHAQQQSFTGEAYEEYIDEDGEVGNPAEEESNQSLQNSLNIPHQV